MLSDTDKKNFNTLIRAFLNHDACLVEATDTKTGKTAAVICAVEFDATKSVYTLTPFACMIEGDPYKKYIPPSLPDELKKKLIPSVDTLYAFTLKHRTNTGFSGQEEFKITEESALELRRFLNALPKLPLDTDMTRRKK